MSFSISLDFEICPVSCSELKLTDTTCVYAPYNPYFCTDGYNIPGDIDVYDIDYTLFNFILPDGSIYNDVDILYQVGRKARIELVWSAGTTGSIGVLIDGLVIGGVSFNTNGDTTMANLVASINVNASNGIWTAQIKDGTTDTIVIEAVSYGNVWNNKLLTLVASGDIVLTINGSGPYSDLTGGANGFTNEFCFNLFDILGNDCDEQQLQCGVYKITYRLFDVNDFELARQTKHVLLDCCITMAIKEWIMLMNKENCCDSKMDERILELRLMQEKAQMQFQNCMYDCAQKTIDKAKKYINNICLDC